MRSLVKRAAKLAIGVVAPRIPQLQTELDRALTVFVYHDVSDAPAPFSQECELVMSVKQFERQMRFVAQTFNVVSIDEVLSGRVPRRAALITFDDGLAGIFHHALPVLRRFNLPSTIFLNMAPVVTGEPFWAARVVYLTRHVEGFIDFLVERVGSHVRRFPHLAATPALVEVWEQEHGDHYLSRLAAYMGAFASREDLRAADGDSLVAFGDHLYQHYHMLNLSDTEVEAECETNERALSGYRNARPVFAFPFGRGFTEHQVELLLACGMKRLFSVIPSLNHDPDAPLLHRIALTSWHDRPSRLWFQITRAAVDGRLHSSCRRSGWGQEWGLDHAVPNGELHEVK